MTLCLPEGSHRWVALLITQISKNDYTDKIGIKNNEYRGEFSSTARMRTGKADRFASSCLSIPVISFHV
jgi:hypothetical protein